MALWEVAGIFFFSIEKCDSDPSLCSLLSAHGRDHRREKFKRGRQGESQQCIENRWGAGGTEEVCLYGIGCLLSIQKLCVSLSA